MKDESPKNKLISKIASVNNILITVSRNPSIDQLSSALGLALAVNKMGKRAVAVFSGKIPNAINFLHPEKTFEDNADSLRDFIISLSRDKADRLQCKPEGDFVKVYITPYKTKITPDDLKFEEGDFNIELIIAIGVGNREDLDAAVASHGKIFHNAIVATINYGQTKDVLGTISWRDERASCYSEMCSSLVDDLADPGQSLTDDAIATAFLTGVVAATNQFRNNRTTPAIMTLAANLMARGANQQLITSELANETNDEPRIEDMQPTPRLDNALDVHPDEDINPPVAPLVSSANQINDEVVNRQIDQDRANLGQSRSMEALNKVEDQLNKTANPMSVATDVTKPATDSVFAGVSSNNQANMTHGPQLATVQSATGQEPNAGQNSSPTVAPQPEFSLTSNMALPPITPLAREPQPSSPLNIPSPNKPSLPPVLPPMNAGANNGQLSSAPAQPSGSVGRPPLQPLPQQSPLTIPLDDIKSNSQSTTDGMSSLQPLPTTNNSTLPPLPSQPINGNMSPMGLPPIEPSNANPSIEMPLPPPPPIPNFGGSEVNTASTGAPVNLPPISTPEQFPTFGTPASPSTPSLSQPLQNQPNIMATPATSLPPINPLPVASPLPAPNPTPAPSSDPTQFVLPS